MSTPATGIFTVKTIVYRAVVSLVTGSPLYVTTATIDPGKIKPGTVIRLDTNNSDPRRTNAAPNDYPQLLVEYGRWRFSGDSGTPRYGDQNPGKPSGRVKTLTLWLKLVVTHRDLRAVPDDAIELGLIDALESAGATLGIARNVLPFVQRGDIDVQTQDVAANSATPQSQGTRRAQSTLSFPVIVRWQQDPSPTQTVTQ